MSISGPSPLKRRLSGRGARCISRCVGAEPGTASSTDSGTGMKVSTKMPIVAQAANREHVQFVAVTRITRDAAAHYRQRTRYQVQRGPDRLLKVVLIGNFLPEVRQRPKRVYQLCSLFDHCVVNRRS